MPQSISVQQTGEPRDLTARMLLVARYAGPYPPPNYSSAAVAQRHMESSDVVIAHHSRVPFSLRVWLSEAARHDDMSTGRFAAQNLIHDSTGICTCLGSCLYRSIRSCSGSVEEIVCRYGTISIMQFQDPSFNLESPANAALLELKSKSAGTDPGEAPPFVSRVLYKKIPERFSVRDG